MSVTSPARLKGLDFLNVFDLSADEIRWLLRRAAAMKAGEIDAAALAGRTVALIFQKPSMRTRVSFQVAAERLGGRVVVLGDPEIGIGRRESVHDMGSVLERYVDGIVARLSHHSDLEQLAQASAKPVINALTDRSHPCQIMADLLTIEENVAPLNGALKVAFVGDGNNVVFSLIEAASRLGFGLTIVSPAPYQPSAELVARAPTVTVSDQLDAVIGADVIYTDVWTSMGMEAESEIRWERFRPYRVDAAVMARAPRARFMHCLPAHRDQEVAPEVIDGPASMVFDQAENRLWVQMALLASIL